MNTAGSDVGARRSQDAIEEEGRDGLDQPWARTLPARMAREFIICGLLDSIISLYGRVEVTGHEYLSGLRGPVIFAANHSSHVDTPIILRSLPGRWRRRTACVAAADYFYTHRLRAAVVSLAFSTVPIERQAGSGTNTTERLRPFIDGGWSLVVYPEGTRTRDGRVAPLRPGAAALAMQLGLPLVPVCLRGTGELMPVGARWPRRVDGDRVDVTVSFGAPIPVSSDDDRFELMEGVRRFMAECGAETTPDPKYLRRRKARA